MEHIEKFEKLYMQLTQRYYLSNCSLTAAYDEYIKQNKTDYDKEEEYMFKKLENLYTILRSTLENKVQERIRSGKLKDNKQCRLEYIKNELIKYLEGGTNLKL
jgi:hypothetical protein